MNESFNIQGMKIRTKIIFVVLPLVIVTLILAGSSAYFSATHGITRLTKEFLGFKASELQKYAESQWSLLVDNNLTDNPEMLEATKAGIRTFAQSIVRSATEIILAVDEQADAVMSTGEIKILPEEKNGLLTVIKEKRTDLVTVVIGRGERVGKGFYFEPFKWYFMITELKSIFYQEVDRITQQTIIIILISSALAILLLYFFARYLTDPLSKVVTTMKDIISTSDMRERVTVEFKDETGQLAHTFNIMIGELEKAYNQIKSYAFKAVLAQKKEQKIRNIFQKYVPRDVIDRFFQHPESMLVGENRVLSILFSDIRSFTTISEGMMPDDLVNSLNKYFSYMVDVIMNHNGIVDKYIGDAIMAFFGAPVKHKNDALESVLAGIEMIEVLEKFNASQRETGKPEFHIGVGINYGIVTVGNIGTEKKMDYTVIGDMVNLASRLEGLTKEYKQSLIISESLHMKIKDDLPVRLIDAVAVKGKTKGARIFTTKRNLTANEEKAWNIHNTGMEHYYNREFQAAGKCFTDVLQYLPGDYCAELFIERSRNYEKNPPDANWDGVTHMKTK